MKASKCCRKWRNTSWLINHALQPPEQTYRLISIETCFLTAEVEFSTFFFLVLVTFIELISKIFFICCSWETNGTKKRAFVCRKHPYRMNYNGKSQPVIESAHNCFYQTARSVSRSGLYLPASLHTFSVVILSLLYLLNSLYLYDINMRLSLLFQSDIWMPPAPRLCPIKKRKC